MKKHPNSALRGFLLSLLAGVSAMSSAQSRLICRLTDPQFAPAVASSYGIAFSDTTSPAPFVLFTLPPGLDPHFVKQAMASDPRVVWAEDDLALESPETTSGKGSVGNVIADRPYLIAQNATSLTQIRAFHGYGRPTRSVRVAILDTGLSPLVQRMWSRVVASTNAFESTEPAFDLPEGLDTNGNGEKDDGAGHGTMVAGIIDLISTCDLVIAKVADSDGVASAWTVTKGLAFAVRSGAEVANVSLGSIERLTAIGDVLDWTDTNGLLVVAAIGNNNFSSSLYPARYNKAICVSGVDSNDVKASFSNWSSDADVAAPAVGFESTWWDGRSAIWSGTSFTAPLVSAAVAEALGQTTRLPTAPLRRTIAQSGDSIDQLNPSFRGKLGRRLNMFELIRSVVNSNRL